MASSGASSDTEAEKAPQAFGAQGGSEVATSLPAGGGSSSEEQSDVDTEEEREHALALAMVDELPRGCGGPLAAAEGSLAGNLPLLPMAGSQPGPPSQGILVPVDPLPLAAAGPLAGPSKRRHSGSSALAEAAAAAGPNSGFPPDVAGDAAAKRAAREGGPAAAEAHHRPQLHGVRIDSCMARFSLGIKVDVPALGRALPNSQMSSSRRSRRPKTLSVRSLRQPLWSALVYRCGRVRITTNCAGEPARMAAKRFARLVRKRYSASVAFKHYRVLYMMVGARLGFRVNTLGLGQDQLLSSGVDCHVINCSLKQISIVVRSGKGKRTVQILDTGRIKAMGAESLQEALAVMEALLPVIRRHGMWW